MLTPPRDLPSDRLRAVLSRHWSIHAETLEYVPLGFGSHHWRADDGDREWFVTVDELATPRQASFERLTAALGTARALFTAGLDFVVAPEIGTDGAVSARAGTRFAVSCFPYLAGEHFDWGEFRDEGQRQAVFEMIVAVHGAAVPDSVRADDFTITHRAEIDAALAGEVIDAGPYAAPMADLLTRRAEALRGEFARYDALAAAARATPARAVVTHGEPHAGNTIRSPEGWRLLDWDTALVAPPERDLWDLDPGDGSLLTAYTHATGVRPRPELIELYRRRWDLTDAAEYVHRFRRPHTDSADDDRSWSNLVELIDGMS
ncbi:phosphotransferase family protein [Nocardia sp. NPDC088792]|uniref:phosphotransferase family protein n=1 Tax=Nocardia sp. NPDC088792 TaxID=3364332 RepID=UPI00380958B0